MDVEELYQELIVDHFKHPRHRGPLTTATESASLFNPLCGDQVEVHVQIENGIVKAIAFEGKGCSISQASASMMTELCVGKDIATVRSLLNAFTKMMKGEGTDDELESLGDAGALQGVKKFAARIKCAMLAWEAVEQCLKKSE